MPPRQILHIDMDAFFASVEVRDNPDLRGKPVLVGGQHRGVVCAASYEARRFGVHSAMPMSTALKRCPEAIVVPPRHKHYGAVSSEIFAIFARFTPLIEGLSLDEAFLDVTDSQTLFGDGARIARSITDEIARRVHLTASAGVAPCKFVAKIASDLRKPAGLVVVAEHEVRSFLAPLPIERIWGVGKVAADRLHRLGFRTIGQLAAANAASLLTLGDWGADIRRLALGDDPRPVIADAEAKSISAERTFEEDVTGVDDLKRAMLEQCLRVTGRMNRLGLSARTVQVKIKYADFKQETRRLTLATPICDADTLYETACAMLSRFDYRGRAVRLCGVGMSDLREGPPPPELFPDPQSVRRRQLEALRLRVQERFGDAALTRATLLPRS